MDSQWPKDSLRVVKVLVIVKNKVVERKLTGEAETELLGDRLQTDLEQNHGKQLHDER